jgi:hypothetical protein
MRTTEWTCDRCGTTQLIPDEIIPGFDWAGRETVVPPDMERTSHNNPPSEWSSFVSTEDITDVCPNCHTDAERVGRLLHDVDNSEDAADFARSRRLAFP